MHSSSVFVIVCGCMCSVFPLSLQEPSRQVQVVMCARTPELAGLLERDLRKCLVRVETAFCSDAVLVPGGGWIEASCVAALEEEVQRGGEVEECCEWSNIHGPPWMGPLRIDYRDIVMKGVINGFRSYLTTLAHNVCAEGGSGVEAFLSEVAELGAGMPGVLDLAKVKVDVWTKAVDFAGLTNRGMR